MRPMRLVPVLLLLGLMLGGPPASGQENPEERMRPGHCPCDGGQACWHYLRAPMKAPEDPCRCGVCDQGGDCGSRPRPAGTSAACWSSGKEECFFKRHAFSWGIECSECWAEDECEACDADIGGRRDEVLAVLEQQKTLEGHTDREPLFIAVTKHFYVVTDIHRELKVRTQGGGMRLISGHEFVHLYAQRCEQAYEDFLHAFGGRGVILGKPMAVYLFQKNRRKEAVAAAYLGSENTDMLYGGGSNRIAQGFAGNGFVGSLQENRKDQDLHAYCRHMIGHILFSCWLKVNGQEKYCPKWAFIGAAHFLEKQLEMHEDYATFCSNETTAPSGSPKDWDRKARALSRRRLDPIETFFARESMGAFSYEDHIRAWSYMDLMLREDNERWLKVLAALRHGADEGAAFKEGLGMTPDAFHERWVERLAGKRDSMAPERGDDEGGDDPDRRERERLRTVDDADVLAGLIRGLDVIEDVETARIVVSRFDHPTDLVRETIHLILTRTKNEDVLAWLRTEGLEDDEELVRAGIARVLGEIRHAPAREALEAMLEDRSWLVRAESAWALGRIGDEASLPALVEALDDRTEKSWILVADAVASFGRRSEEATEAIAPRLDDREWQVRVTAARALAAVGTQAAIDPLIERFNREGGRLYKELHGALKAVTNDDLGPNPETWRRWWEERKAEHGGLGPQPEQRNPADDRYGQPPPGGPDDPHYYGHRIYSKSVGFVFDTSGSMDKTISLTPQAEKMLEGIPVVGTRMQLAQEVLVAALEKLDPRTRFSIVFFSSNVRPWKDRLIPATPGNVGSAQGAVRAQPADGETNIHGALRAALGLFEKPTLEADLDPIPDTVYFMTDGSPTRGEITGADALLSWFEGLNRYAKVELHVIALGNLGVDLGFLSRLAQAGGGEFLHVPER